MAARGSLPVGSNASAVRKETFGAVVANCMHSYAVIRTAAEELVKTDKWKDDTTVNGLAFSDHWVHSFIRRFNLSRQVITKKHKTNRPSPAEVNAEMRPIQNELKSGAYSLSDIYNMDETPLCLDSILSTCMRR